MCRTELLTGVPEVSTVNCMLMLSVAVAGSPASPAVVAGKNPFHVGFLGDAGVQRKPKL